MSPQTFDVVSILLLIGILLPAFIPNKTPAFFAIGLLCMSAFYVGIAISILLGALLWSAALGAALLLRSIQRRDRQLRTLLDVVRERRDRTAIKRSTSQSLFGSCHGRIAFQ